MLELNTGIPFLETDAGFITGVTRFHSGNETELLPAT
jgi:hypothetical protein